MKAELRPSEACQLATGAIGRDATRRVCEESSNRIEKCSRYDWIAGRGLHACDFSARPSPLHPNFPDVNAIPRHSEASETGCACSAMERLQQITLISSLNLGDHDELGSD